MPNGKETCGSEVDGGNHARRILYSRRTKSEKRWRIVKAQISRLIRARGKNITIKGNIA